MAKLSKNLLHPSFWSINSNRRSFNTRFFSSVNYIYRNVILNDEAKRNGLARQYDLFLMPWAKTNQLKYSCSFEKIQSMLYQAMRAVNMRIPANSESPLSLKIEIRMYSLPFFINLLILEVANKVWMDQRLIFVVR